MRAARKKGKTLGTSGITYREAVAVQDRFSRQAVGKDGVENAFDQRLLARHVAATKQKIASGIKGKDARFFGLKAPADRGHFHVVGHDKPREWQGTRHIFEHLF